MKQHKEETSSKTERTPNEMLLSLAKQRLEELAKEAERSKFFGTQGLIPPWRSNAYGSYRPTTSVGTDIAHT